MKNAFKENFRSIPGRLLVLFGALFISLGLLTGQLSANQETGKSEAECVEPRPELIETSKSAQPRDIFFNHESIEIREDAKEVLVDNARILRANPEMFIIVQGEWNTNETAGKLLGESRAHKVREFIISQGIEAGRILTTTNCGQYEKNLTRSPEYQELGSKVHFISMEPDHSGFVSIFKKIEDNLEG